MAFLKGLKRTKLSLSEEKMSSKTWPKVFSTIEKL